MKKRIDCKNSVDYLKTRAIATKLDENGYCQIHWDDCVLKDQTITKRCEVLEYLYPEESIKILQNYADEHLNGKDDGLEIAV